MSRLDFWAVKAMRSFGNPAFVHFVGGELHVAEDPRELPPSGQFADEAAAKASAEKCRLHGYPEAFACGVGTLEADGQAPTTFYTAPFPEEGDD